MMKLPYFPGCSLKTTARNFEKSALASARALDIELVELPRWNCCGTVTSLATDDLIHHLASVRDLIRTEEMEGENTQLVALCSMCYNTLSQTNLLVKGDEEKMRTINLFMDEENDYEGTVTVRHLLSILRDDIGFDRIASKVKMPLKNLRVAPYYGCLLLRPKEVGIDDPEEPTIMSDLLLSLGAEPVDTPMKVECCGSYHTVDKKDSVADIAHTILTSAARNGAESIVLSCPLCHFNLDARQEEVERRYAGFQKMPVFFFTQLLALALGLGAEACGFERHYVDPRPLLMEKDLIEDVS